MNRVLDGKMEDSKKQSNSGNEQEPDIRAVDPMDLVYKGGFTGNAREIVDNPAVAPQMLNPPEYLRDDMLESGDEIGDENE
jgi:hypothetical protein